MEKKNMLVLFGSPRPNGATAKLLEAFLQKVDTNSVRITTFDAYKGNYHPCTACGYCQTREACIFSDLDEFDRELREADYFIVAAPVYHLSFPAPCKAVMDRWQRYFEARFAMGIRPSIHKPKTAALLTAYGSQNAEGAQMMARQLELAFTVMNTKLEHVVEWPHTDLTGIDEIPAEIADKARAAALAMTNKT
ncbi:MAG: flavodoxin family protein [Clostridium sp.]|uniref:flavodoxin family protein n=1 Tax=Clostridium sp. TaxID=1506 RepID=UPI0029152002|nr:flavodoxin family protein [Clostridium sp.]MDU7337915.1 flavodoxin family protein [Clostridium sp.]